MKPVLPILALTLAAASCTTPYKSGQTPDDVYYSPVKPEHDYVEAEEKQEVTQRDETREDRFLRMRMHNRQRWSQFDDYYSDPYAYHANTCSCQCNSNPHLAWGYYYSPYLLYYHGYTYLPIRPAAPNQPRGFNFDAYRPPTVPVYAPGKTETYSSSSSSTPSYGGTRGGGLRATMNGSTRGSTPAPSSSGSSSSSSTPSAPRNAPVRRF